MTEPEKIPFPVVLQNLQKVCAEFRGTLQDHMGLQASLKQVEELWAEKQARDKADAEKKEVPGA